jgi:hypothetical protein
MALKRLLIALLILSGSAFMATSTPAANQGNRFLVQPDSGLRVRPLGDHGQLQLLLPDQPETERGIEVDCPEHVTVQRQGAEVEHLYMLRNPNYPDLTVQWRRDGNSLKYDLDLPHHLHLAAKATLETDGVRIRYDFTNQGEESFEMLQAPTCVKHYSGFHDARLERTYVHHAEGFDLAASETPERLTEPLNQWLPCRYLIPYTGPISPTRVERAEGDIRRYHKSRRVDLPLVATLSQDGSWLAATCTRADSGNVWTNPDLTCHHTDPVTRLAPHGKAHIEIKTYAFRGNLDTLLPKVKRELNR